MSVLPGIFQILGILAAGLLIGYLLRRRKKLISICDRVTTVLIWALLFVLGAWVGTNEEVMDNLHGLLLDAGILCIASVAGSLLVLSVAAKLLPKRPPDDT